MDNTNIRQETNKYKKFKKVDGATYRKVNQFLRKRTYITAREWALARLCTDFRTSGGAEMTFIGKHLPDLVPFMEDTYTPQAVNQARNSFKKKVRKSSATFFYGAMCGFFTTDELDDLLFEASEVARFLLEVEGTTLDIDEEIDIEDRITRVMRSVGEAAKTILSTRGKDNGGGPQSPASGLDTPKVVPAPDDTVTITPHKQQLRKKTRGTDALQHLHVEPVLPEKAAVLSTISERSAILGIVSSPDLPESALLIKDVGQMTISNPSTTISLPRENEASSTHLISGNREHKNSAGRNL